MPKRKRYLPNRTSIPIEANSLGLNEDVSHGQPHSEPLAQNGISLHHVGQTDLSPQPIPQDNSPTHIVGQAGTSSHQVEAPPFIEPEALPSIEPEAQNAPSDGYGKKSTKYWIVELEDENGVVKEGRLKLKDVWVLPTGTKVIVHWNRFNQPVGKAGGLLGAFLGAVAGNFKNFPICYERWAKVLGSYKKVAYESIIQAICDKNAANRQMQTVPHTFGSKTMARKQHELETANKRTYSRAQMYPISHKKKDGSFINDEARDKSVQLAVLESDGISSQDTHISAFAKLFGKEHPGHVRGMGFGVCPSQIFKSISSHCGWTSSSCSHGSETAKIQEIEAELKDNKATLSILQAQVNYFVKHYMGGVVASDFPTIGGNGIADLESPMRARPSSSASHEPQDNGPSNIWLYS